MTVKPEKTKGLCKNTRRHRNHLLTTTPNFIVCSHKSPWYNQLFVVISACSLHLWEAVLSSTQPRVPPVGTIMPAPKAQRIPWWFISLSSAEQEVSTQPCVHSWDPTVFSHHWGLRWDTSERKAWSSRQKPSWDSLNLFTHKDVPYTRCSAADVITLRWLLALCWWKHLREHCRVLFG